MDTRENPCRLPLMTGEAGEKDYYRLDSHNRLQHWKFTAGSWKMAAADLFQQPLEGFDGALDRKGLMQLLGYDHRGNIYHLDAGNRAKKIQTISPQKINSLSCCFTPSNQLQILYLSSPDAQKQWQHLYYLYKSSGESSVSLVDTVAGGASFCSIFSDRLNRLYLIYPLLDEGAGRIALRCLETAGSLPGRIYLLPGKQERAGPPSFYSDPQNNLHLAWISRSSGKAYLNYIQREITGRWRHFMQVEVPPPTLPVVPFSCTAKELLIFVQGERRLSLFYSRNGGAGWYRGKDREIGQESMITRLRLGGRDGPKPEQSSNFLLNFTLPPQNLTSAPPGSKEIENHKTMLRGGELHSMAVISAAVLEHIHCLEADNSRLREQLQEKEKELAILEQQEQLKTVELERLRAEKQRYCLEGEQLYKDKEKLQRHQGKQEQEIKTLREQLTLLRSDIIKLQNKKEQLTRENSELKRRISSYAEVCKGRKERS